ncbi:MAG TPA: hypothetical protein VHB69_05460 [Mycobacteriales bacterium]|nr:hypothetical protein [Mycobacteriales bacterium]
MVRRMFYVAVGATVGVIAVRKATQVAHRLTPKGMAEQAGGMGGRIAEWWQIVQDTAAVREAELREALGIDEPRPEDRPGPAAA